ncbi:pyridoxal phosphate-dependent aminotransferase [Thermococcus aggregans]|uniref:Aminotransferase n=1 Tax=Thermococcus aggregans TaxID=110163 RepID=A0A9E7MWE8_THEAG|nr:pyridoxal phosphate-dependent aminotransferase [Thermococcus aggregans]USS40055.1 pyridoxal phosphate-dependent aminotransferase [Thermococcus aggregans]
MRVVIDISEKLKKVEPSATVEVVTLARKLEEKGYDVISFGIGEPDFHTPRKIIEWAYEAMKEGYTHYTPPAGLKETREAIAEKYREENNVDATWENVIITPSKFGIFTAMASVLNPGDEVLIPNPGWVSYCQMAKLLDAKPIGYSVSIRDRAINEEEIKEKITNKTKMIVINSPSNPLGTVFSIEDMKFIRDIAQDKNLIVLSDEIYEKIIYEGRFISPASFEGMLERTIIVNGFSKMYAMTGWRIGYIIAPKTLTKEMTKFQSHTLTCAPAFAQVAVAKALRDDETQEEVKKMIEEYSRRRELVYNELKKIELFEAYKPKGTFYVFPKYNYPMKSSDFARMILEKKHVVVTPGSAFGSLGEGHVRISFATSRENIKKGMERIRELVEEL